MVGGDDQGVAARVERVQLRHEPAELLVDVTEGVARHRVEHPEDVSRVVGCLVVHEQQAGGLGRSDLLVLERRLDQIALVADHRRAAAVHVLRPHRVERCVSSGVRDVAGAIALEGVERRGDVGQPVELVVLAPPVLRVALLVPVDRDRPLVAAARRPAAPDHPEVPHLVAELADPCPIVRRVAPEVREGRHEDVARVHVAELAVGLAHPPAVAEVVPGDAVGARERARPDRGVGRGRDGRERAVQRVAEVRAVAHQPPEVRPGVGVLLEDVPPAPVDHEGDDHLGCHAGARDTRQRTTVTPEIEEAVEPDQLGDRRGDVGEGDAVLGVRRRDRGAVDDERHAFEVHPDARVARPGVVGDQRQRLLRVVRAVERGREQLDVAAPVGVIRAARRAPCTRRPGRGPSPPGPVAGPGASPAGSSGRARRRPSRPPLRTARRAGGSAVATGPWGRTSAGRTGCPGGRPPDR